MAAVAMVCEASGRLAGRSTRRVRLLGVLALAVAVSGCETPPVRPLSAEAVRAMTYLDFVEDGSTTREQTLLKLGLPSAQFEDERILTYVLRLNEIKQLQVVTTCQRGTAYPGQWRSGISGQWQPGVYSLVLVFGPDGVLERHSVIAGQ